jgi:hypothetical protein
MGLRDRYALRVHLAKGFFDSYLSDLGAIALIDPRMGVQEALLPAGARRVTYQRLHGLLNDLGVKEALLEQISHEAFAKLVESETWRCLRPELMSRSLEVQPFNHKELEALQRARKVRRRAGRTNQQMLEELLQRQHDALERAQLKATREPRLRRALFAAEESMGISAAFPDPFRPGWRNKSSVPPERLTRMLEQVLDASTVGEAQTLIERFDLIIEQYGGQRADALAELVLERAELSEQARRLPDGLRTALINFGTGTSSSVVGQGLMLALKALGL